MNYSDFSNKQEQITSSLLSFPCAWLLFGWFCTGRKSQEILLPFNLLALVKMEFKGSGREALNEADHNQCSDSSHSGYFGILMFKPPQLGRGRFVHTDTGIDYITLK